MNARSAESVRTRDWSEGVDGKVGTSSTVRCGWVGVLWGQVKERDKVDRAGDSGDPERSVSP
jgi:hypothetical protein